MFKISESLLLTDEGGEGPGWDGGIVRRERAGSGLGGNHSQWLVNAGMVPAPGWIYNGIPIIFSSWWECWYWVILPEYCQSIARGWQMSF